MFPSLQTKLKKAGKWLPMLLLPVAAQAQFNYLPSNTVNVAGTYTDLAATGTAIATANNDDANSAPQSIGFPFSYNGTSFTQFVLSTNGMIKLGATPPSAADLFICNVVGCTNVDPVESTDPANVNLIMPFNFDLEPGTGTPEYRVATTGTAPNRVCTIQWKNVRDKADATPSNTQYSNFSFQAKLYETSNRIEFVYGPVTPSTAPAESRFPNVGIKGSSAAAGQDVLASKTTGAAAWSTTTFITGSYPGSTHNFRNAAPPDLGRTYRFSATTCAPVTGLTSGSITNTSASLSFTAPAGATGYIVTVTPQGGTATTITPAPTSSPVNLTGLTLGTTYTVSVTNNCGTGNTSAPVTTTFTTTGGPGAPANDLCANATPLSVSATCTPVTGTNAGATASGTTAPAPTCGAPTSGTLVDVWYSVTVPANGSVTVTTSAITGSLLNDTVLEIYSGTCGALTSVACNDDATGNYSNIALTGQTAGATLYVRVRTYGTTPNGQFGICATSPTGAVCADPTAASITNVTNTSASINFTPGAGNTSYIVTYYPTATPAMTTTVTPAPTASPITVSGLTPGTAYTITIQSVCSAGGMGQVLSGTFTTQTAAAPANDNPAGAVALTIGTTCTPTNGTNVGATTTTPNGYTNPSTTPNTCGVALNPRDVWYSFTTAASGAGSTGVNVTVTGNPAGSVRVFRSASGAAGPFTQVACTAGATNNMVAPALAVTGLTASTTYYIAVAGVGSGDTQGAFTICVTAAGAPAPCVASAPQATTITTTSANTTFTTNTGATYRVSLRNLTAGGAPVVVQAAATASPVALSGLAAATRYRVYILTSCAGGGQVIDSTDFVTRGLPVNNVAAGNFSATSATVTFTAPAGATTYTVTYVPQGGTTPVTITVSASPFTLTGLTANTTYNLTIVANYANGATSTPVTATFRVPFGLATRTTLGSGSMSVSPNPAHSNVTLTLPAIAGAQVAQVMLLNSLGQQVQARTLQLNATGTQTMLDVSSLAAGLYTLRVQAAGQTATQQVVVQ